MKATVFVVLSGLSLSAQDISFTNKVASFTNLEGKSYPKVTLVKGDLDGLVWRDENGGGGRICYTNLPEDFLDSLGIPLERVAIARDRAERKTASDARYHATLLAEDQAQLLAKQAEWAKNTTVAAQVPNPANPYAMDAPAYPMYSYDYAPFYPYGFGSGRRAASAHSAPSAPSAASVAPVSSAPSVPLAQRGQSSISALISASTLPAPSAPSAPRSGGFPGPVPHPTPR